MGAAGTHLDGLPLRGLHPRRHRTGPRRGHCTWAAVAHAVAGSNRSPWWSTRARAQEADRYLSRDIEIIEAPLNDAWMRDIGPTFVHAADGSVAAVDWVFNGWGAQEWAQWDLDSGIGRFVAETAGTPVIGSALVNEGGGIQVDGEGTVLLTDTVQLDPGRNRRSPGPRSRSRWPGLSGPPMRYGCRVV